MQKVIKTLAELEAEAKNFVGTLAPFGASATLVTLSGELGAGKTTFTQAVARALGVEETVTSPTFVLEKIYLLPEQRGNCRHGVSAISSFVRLVHVDAYRLEKGADLVSLGFDELMQDSGNLILFEWPEKVAGALPAPAVKISLVANPDGSRTFIYD